MRRRAVASTAFVWSIRTHSKLPPGTYVDRVLLILVEQKMELAKVFNIIIIIHLSRLTKY